MNQIRVCVSLWCLAAGKLLSQLHSQEFEAISNAECFCFCFSRKHTAFVACLASNLLVCLSGCLFAVCWWWRSNLLRSNGSELWHRLLHSRPCAPDDIQHTEGTFLSCLHFNIDSLTGYVPSEPDLTSATPLSVSILVCLAMDMHWLFPSVRLMSFGEQ